MEKNELLDIMLERRSIREYTGEPIPMEKLNAVIEAGLSAPSSRGRRPWELIVIRDRQTLIALSGSRMGSARMLAGADAAIVVLGDEDLSDVWVEDCSIVMAHMHLMADSLGLGSCWIQGRNRDARPGQLTTENYIRSFLKFPSNYRLLAMLSLGIPAVRPEARQVEDLPFDKVHINRF